MANSEQSLASLWRTVGFKPNDNQRKAILHTSGPLYLPAGPGSGKTRVLLWRTLNLILFHAVKPDEIFLSTFTEKAALQLREGLRGLLALATARSGEMYDVSRMYVGTVHSLCQRLVADRRFSVDGSRPKSPALLDELAQHFFIYKKSQWDALLKAAGLGSGTTKAINKIFGRNATSRHEAVGNCIRFFNRLSEECIDSDRARRRTRNKDCRMLLDLYAAYRASLEANARVRKTDFSLLQQQALNALKINGAENVFRHVIVDEYQDTNTIQERLFFRLAAGHKNLCVVGDDDQALYRFRGATVENFVEFPSRCAKELGTRPTILPLGINYRSRRKIVDFYCKFIDECDWHKKGRRGFYRVANKQVRAASTDKGPSVVISTADRPETVTTELAALVKRLVVSGKVEDPNQIAFLYPSLKSGYVRTMIAALKREGLHAYAPRAGRFLEVREAVDVFGLCLQVFGKPDSGGFGGAFQEFCNWIDGAFKTGRSLIAADSQLARFVEDRQTEIRTVIADYTKLSKIADRSGWRWNDAYDVTQMQRRLAAAPSLSLRARRDLTSQALARFIRRRADWNQPVSVGYVINRATSLDWNVLDLFYRLCGFKHFKAMFDLAESAGDEGPICNLALISQYLSRYLEEYPPMLTGRALADGGVNRGLFSSFLYTLFRRGESEFENAEDPFPRGRIPFLTIHQAKGLEFPVVVLGNPRKDGGRPQRVEELVHPLIEREGEPLDRMAEFDAMRMFYVALSRAKNLLVIARYKGQGHRLSRPFENIVSELPELRKLDVAKLSIDASQQQDIPQSYSYTADYLLYRKCPRQYMIFRKYGFAPSRSQTMFFGSLVHQTIEDLHQYLIAHRRAA